VDGADRGQHQLPCFENDCRDASYDQAGGARVMHWMNGFIVKGAGRATVFNTGPAAMTANFHAGDIGSVKKGLGHYLENAATHTSYTWKSRAPPS
jgi:hypothetical protein